MDARSIIAAKRAGATLSGSELGWFARGLASGAVSDAQAGAFAMAVLWRGLSRSERVALTLAMRDSGEVMRWDLPGPVLDKHSTGGVGDLVSLALAPMLAACGAFVPMLSGRGLGHTGGTLDKLEAIPGYRAEADAERLSRVVRAAGCAIVGATSALAPADRRLYAVRDVTATVESLDLIVSSILSKKLAAGLEGLVLDVKQGSGAFLPGAEEARALATALVETAGGAGCPTVALITDMDAPLAPVAGNALEVGWACAFLSGAHRHSRTGEVTLALGEALLVLGGLARKADEARARLLAALDSGAAAERFGKMVAGLGGPADLMEAPNRHLPRATIVRDVPSRGAGHVAAIDTRALGLAVVALGGGRARESDPIDPAVGLSDIAAPGAALTRGAPLARVHASSPAAADAAVVAVQAAFSLADAAPPARPLVSGRVG
ncbi:MAG: thymidine phosphorylase [Rhodobacteraceae bacterium]|nr:thymidine phosphorylase [Paracoccaceae bacterium]